MGLCEYIYIYIYIFVVCVCAWGGGKTIVLLGDVIGTRQQQISSVRESSQKEELNMYIPSILAQPGEDL